MGIENNVQKTPDVAASLNELANYSESLPTTDAGQAAGTDLPYDQTLQDAKDQSEALFYERLQSLLGKSAKSADESLKKKDPNALKAACVEIISVVESTEKPDSFQMQSQVEEKAEKNEQAKFEKTVTDTSQFLRKARAQIEKISKESSLAAESKKTFAETSAEITGFFNRRAAREQQVTQEKVFRRYMEKLSMEVLQPQSETAKKCAPELAKEEHEFYQSEYKKSNPDFEKGIEGDSPVLLNKQMKAQADKKEAAKAKAKAENEESGYKKIETKSVETKKAIKTDEESEAAKAPRAQNDESAAAQKVAQAVPLLKKAGLLKEDVAENHLKALAEKAAGKILKGAEALATSDEVLHSSLEAFLEDRSKILERREGGEKTAETLSFEEAFSHGVTTYLDRMSKGTARQKGFKTKTMTPMSSQKTYAPADAEGAEKGILDWDRLKKKKNKVFEATPTAHRWESQKNQEYVKSARLHAFDVARGVTKT
jgi:hypothetical protein